MSGRETGEEELVWENTQALADTGYKVEEDNYEDNSEEHNEAQCTL